MNDIDLPLPKATMDEYSGQALFGSTKKTPGGMLLSHMQYA